MIIERIRSEIGNGQTFCKGIVANLLNAYAEEEEKFSGFTTDNFERKYMLFIKRCDQADILEDDEKRAFFIMLNGAARQHYFDPLKSRMLDLEGLVLAIEN